MVINNQSFPPNPLLSADFRAILFSTRSLLTTPTQQPLHCPFWKACFRKGSRTFHQPWKRLNFTRGVVSTIILANKAFHHSKIIPLLLQLTSQGLRRKQLNSHLRGRSYPREKCCEPSEGGGIYANTHLCSFPGSSTDLSEVTFWWIICIEIILFT